MSAEQRNDRREALLKRQKESREKAQQMSAAARANAAPASTPATTATPTTTAPTSTSTTAPAAPAPAPVAAPAVVADAPVRENMVQQAVSFLSSPSVQSAEESKKTAFLEKKGLTLKEIEAARARVAGTAAAVSIFLWSETAILWKREGRRGLGGGERDRVVALVRRQCGGESGLGGEFDLSSRHELKVRVKMDPGNGDTVFGRLTFFLFPSFFSIG